MTTKLSSSLVVAAVLLFGLLGFATSAFAAVNIQNFGFEINGQSSDTITPGENIDVNVNIDVNGGDEVEWVRVRILNGNGDILHNHCEPLNNAIINAVDKDVRIRNIDTPNDLAEGTHDIQVLTGGIPGNAKSLNCDLANDHGNFTLFENRLFVDGDGDGVVGGDGEISQLSAIVTALTKLIEGFTNGGGQQTNANKAKCDAIWPFLAAPHGQYSALGTQLQSALLLDDPFSIPALKPGSTVPMGFRGPQTNGALGSYNSKYGCL